MDSHKHQYGKRWHDVPGKRSNCKPCREADAQMDAMRKHYGITPQPIPTPKLREAANVS